MRRFGQVLGIRPECIDEYRRHHDPIWPEIAQAITQAGIRNYSIFLHNNQLFGYFEYVGDPTEFESSMQTLSAAPRMREWWDILEPMQIPDPARPPGTWWTTMPELFHLA